MKKYMLAFMMVITCGLSAHTHDKLLGASKFKQEVLETDEVVLVDFYSRNCAPCRMLAPEFDEASFQMKGRVKFFSVNVDQEGGLAGEYQVRSIPTLLVFKDGKVVDKRVGFMECEEIVQWLNSRKGE